MPSSSLALHIDWMPSLETLMTLPEFRVTASTPPKPSSSLQTSAIRDTFPRLLYRGALSLPDSHLLLDGLTFTIDLPTDDQQASLKLLETPIPLALESMRGRPSLSFVGIERLDAFHEQKLRCDFDGGVNLYVSSNLFKICPRVNLDTFAIQSRPP